MVCALTNTVLSLLKPALDIIYPHYCGGCGAQGKSVCPACEKAFEKIDEEACCPLCGRWIGKRVICGACTGNRTYFTEGHFGFSFQGPLREAIHSFKFAGRKDVGRHLVQLLSPYVQSMSDRFDVIAPLPVTEKRLKERGFNQSYIIAEELGGLTGKPINYTSLRKIRETADQYSLSREERRRNIRGAFAVENGREITKNRILLVDDLFTTGNTAREASRVLLKAKAQKIVLFTLARTPS